MANIGFPDFSIFDPSSWIPTFGNWCGPGWSGGQRTSEPDFGVDPKVVDGRPSPVDAACKVHDQAYYDAAGQLDEATQILNADIELLRTIASLDWSAMSAEEQTYAALTALAFDEKIGGWDLPTAGLETIQNEASALFDQIKQQFEVASGTNINGTSYTDPFGDNFSCSVGANGNPMLTCQRDTVDGWVKLTFNENGQLVDYVGNGSLGDALEKIFSASLGATGLSNTISSLFTSAQLWVQRRDPLTLDLDGDGLETVALNPTNPIYFDHDGDGNARKIKGSESLKTALQPH